MIITFIQIKKYFNTANILIYIMILYSVIFILIL